MLVTLGGQRVRRKTTSTTAAGEFSSIDTYAFTGLQRTYIVKQINSGIFFEIEFSVSSLP